MSKIFGLVSDLKLCYETKAPTAEQYIKLSSQERKALCNDVRTAVVNYMKSDEYCFYDILRNKLANMESNSFKFLLTFC